MQDSYKIIEAMKAITFNKDGIEDEEHGFKTYEDPIGKEDVSIIIIPKEIA